MNYYARELDGKNFNGIDLRKWSFVHNSLLGVNFNGCNVEGVDFSRAACKNATFVNAKVAGAIFTKCKWLDLAGAIDADKVVGLRPKAIRPSCPRIMRLYLPQELYDVIQDKSRGANLHPQNLVVNVLTWAFKTQHQLDTLVTISLDRMIAEAKGEL